MFFIKVEKYASSDMMDDVAGTNNVPKIMVETHVTCIWKSHLLSILNETNEMVVVKKGIKTTNIPALSGLAHMP